MAEAAPEGAHEAVSGTAALPGFGSHALSSSLPGSTELGWAALHLGY